MRTETILRICNMLPIIPDDYLIVYVPPISKENSGSRFVKLNYNYKRGGSKLLFPFFDVCAG